MLDHTDLKEFFYVKSGEVQTEVEVITEFGDTRRIDRLIVKDKEAVIIDYKSSPAEDDRYEKQVQEYMQILASIYSDKEIKGYLIFLDTFEVKQIDG